MRDHNASTTPACPPAIVRSRQNAMLNPLTCSSVAADASALPRAAFRDCLRANLADNFMTTGAWSDGNRDLA